MEEEFQRKLESDALLALANGYAYAEHGVLDILTKGVIHGFKIGADFQNVANFIIAKSLLKGKLPKQKKGRPKKKTGIDGELVAEEYLELMNGGAGYADAVAQLAAHYHKDERQIMRIVRDNKSMVVAMKTIREMFKPFPELENEIATLNSLRASIKTHFRESADPTVSDDQTRRQIQKIDHQLNEILQGKFATDNK